VAVIVMVERKRLRMRVVPVPEAVGSAGTDFVQAVTGLYHHAINGAPQPHIEIASLPDRDQVAASSVATGLILLRQLLTREMERQDIDAFGVYSVLNAQELLDALVSGADGPIHRYIAHLGSATFGPQRAQANRTAKLRQSWIVGLVFALQEAAKQDGKKLSRERAITSVSEGCGGFYSVDAIKGWVRHGTAPVARDFAKEILGWAGELDLKSPLGLRVYVVGIKMIVTMATHFGRARKSRAERAFVARKK
jgi:hypothetical protein